MLDKLGLIVCSFIAPEIHHILENGNYGDVKLICFKGNCTNCSKNTNSVLNKIDTNQPLKENIVVAGTCIDSSMINDTHNLKYKQLSQSFELFVNREVVEHYTSKGYYIITGGWLKSYKRHIKEWGFEPHIAKQFFGDSVKKLLYLDTFIVKDYQSKLDELAEYMGLSYEILPVGISYCETYIKSLVDDWRKSNEQKVLNRKIAEISKTTADYTLIFTQLKELINITDESKIIENGFDFLNMLFAPSTIVYKSNNKKDYPVRIYKSQFINNSNTDTNCFTIEISLAQLKLGEFEINGVAFPKHIEKYKQLSNPISHIFALSLANARQYEKIIEQSKNLKIYSDKLQKANQTKDRFFTIISHDLKSPFNSLLGFSEILVQNITDNDYSKAVEHAQIINDISSQTFILLNNLLEWAHSQSGHINYNPKQHSFTQIISNQIEVFNDLAKSKNISIENNLTEEIKWFCDKNMLETVLRNLISNAIKFTPFDGKITITVQNLDSTLQVIVSDSGVGISSNRIESLFKVDQTTSTNGTNNEKGSGLGLILCKEFIEKHNGKIWAESSPSTGSSFNFILPYCTSKENQVLTE